MPTVCVACNNFGLGMINIYSHPNEIDKMFTIVTNIEEVNKDDCLCIHCYDDLKKAYHFREKCLETAKLRKSIISAKEAIKVESIEYDCLKNNLLEVEINEVKIPTNPLSPDHDSLIKSTDDQSDASDNDGDDDDKNTIQNVEINKVKIPPNPLSPENDSLIKSTDDQSDASDNDDDDDDVENTIQNDIKKLSSNYNCSLCGKSFTLVHNLFRHKRNVHMKNPRPIRIKPGRNKQFSYDYKCLLCGKLFATSLGLRRHDRIVHLPKDKVNEVEIPTNPSSSENDSIIKSTEQSTDPSTDHLPDNADNNTIQNDAKKLLPAYNCTLCGKSFTIVHNLTRHKRNVHKIECEKPRNKQLASQDLNCLLCGHLFSTSGNLTRHERDVHKINNRKRAKIGRNKRGPCPRLSEQDIFATIKETQCEYCFENFDSIDRRKEHEKLHKMEERPYKCNHENCTSNFKERSGLRNHLETHTNVKRFKCKFCDSRFRQNSQLKYHLRTHTGEKPYLCPHCGKSFAGSGNLVSHLRCHTGERRYQCLVCSKRFTTYNAHQIHVRIHTKERPYNCSVCAKTFISSGHLSQHKKIHTGIRPFKCTICSAAFITRKALRRHSTIH